MSFVCKSFRLPGGMLKDSSYGGQVSMTSISQSQAEIAASRRGVTGAWLGQPPHRNVYAEVAVALREEEEDLQ